MDTIVIGILASLVGLWLLILVVLWLVRPRGVPVRELLGVVPAVVRLMRSFIADRETPLDVKIVLVGLLVWLISPIDLIPEFIPVLGPIDDLVVAVAAMRYVRRRVGRDEILRRWTGTADGYALLVRVIG